MTAAAMPARLAALLLALLAAAPARAERPRVKAPATVTLSGDARPKVQARFPSKPALPVVKASVGKIEDMVVADDGLVTVTYVPPTNLAHPVVFIGAWDDADPGHPGVARIRLEPGPGQPPAEPSEGVRVAILIVPSAVDSGAIEPATVYMLVHDGSGDLVDEAPRLSARAGTVSEPAGDGSGLFVSDYHAPLVVGDSRDTVTASAGGGPVGWAELLVHGLLPKRFEIVADPPEIPADGKAAVTITVILADAAGGGLFGVPVEMEPSAGLIGDTIDRGDGSYEAVLSAPDTVPPEAEIVILVRVGRDLPGTKRLEGSVTVGVVAGDANRAVLVADPRRVPADGRTEVKLRLSLVDTKGNPASGRPVIQVREGELRRRPEQVSPGEWVAIYVPPADGEMAFNRRLRPTIRVGGRKVITRGTLTLEPPGEGVVVAGSREDRVWAGELGWIALVGDGRFADAQGPLLGAQWAKRVLRTPLFVDVRPALAVVLSEQVASDPSGLANGVGEVTISTTQVLLPVVGGIGLRFEPVPGYHVTAGLGLGAMLAYSSASSDVAFGGSVGGLQLRGALMAPVGVELPVGDQRLSVEVRYLRGLGDLSGAGAGGSEVGIVGGVEGVALSAGLRWMDP